MATVGWDDTNRRKWNRLPIGIPMFVKGEDSGGKEFLEFANTVNISAGGALVAIRKFLPIATRVIIEIPSFPQVKAEALEEAMEGLDAEVIRNIPSDRYHLVGFQFNRPLV